MHQLHACFSSDCIFLLHGSPSSPDCLAGLPANDSRAEAADPAAAQQLPAGAGASSGPVEASVPLHETGASFSADMPQDLAFICCSAECTCIKSQEHTLGAVCVCEHGIGHGSLLGISAKESCLQAACCCGLHALQESLVAFSLPGLANAKHACCVSFLAADKLSALSAIHHETKWCLHKAVSNTMRCSGWASSDILSSKHLKLIHHMNRPCHLRLAISLPKSPLCMIQRFSAGRVKMQ